MIRGGGARGIPLYVLLVVLLVTGLCSFCAAADMGVLVDVPANGDVEVPTTPEVPDEPDPGDAPSPAVPDPGGGPEGGTDNLETLPPESSAPDFRLPNGFPFLIIVIIVATLVGSWAPSQVTRIRLEIATRESMDARLALAQGDFVIALAAFDRAIEQAHAAYTKREDTGGTTEWRLLPDQFYISLWKGRSTALNGLGRTRAAEFTMSLAEELEATVTSLS
jgi:hypothetical protein